MLIGVVVQRVQQSKPDYINKLAQNLLDNLFK